MIFGEDDEYGVVLRTGDVAEIVSLENGYPQEELLVHNTNPISACLPYSLSRMKHPVPLGVFWQVNRPTYSEGLMDQVSTAQSKRGVGDLDQMFRNADLWEVFAD